MARRLLHSPRYRRMPLPMLEATRKTSLKTWDIKNMTRFIFIFYCIASAYAFSENIDYGMRNARRTLNIVEADAISNMAKVLILHTEADPVDALAISSILCRHHRHSDPIAFSQQHIDALKKEAQKNRNQGMLDSLKSAEQLFHGNPGASIEEGIAAYQSFQDAIQQYEVFQQMEDHLKNGRVEVWGNGVFLGPNP